MVEEVNDYKCATCLIELEKYLIMRKYSLARHLAEYGDNYRRCEKSRDQYLEDKKNGVQAVDKSAEYRDAMSAIICVIDYEKFKRGIGV